MTVWMLWATVVGMLLALSAHVADSTLRAVRRPARWAWVAAILGAVTMQAWSLLPWSRPSPGSTSGSVAIVDFSFEATTMLEDWLAGVLLLAAGGLAVRGARSAGPFLLAVWSGVTAMMTLSFVSQVEETLRGVDLEPRNGTVLCAKAVLLAVCPVALVRSFRSVAREGAAREAAG